MASAKSKRSSVLNSILGFLLVGALGYGGLAMFGWFDSTAEKAESEARKCGTARKINLMRDAERYCGNAIAYLRDEPNAPALVIARVHTEVAALAIVQKRDDESADQCRLALMAWHSAKDDWYRREREESMDACEKVISAVTLVKQRGNDKGTSVRPR